MNILLVHTRLILVLVISFLAFNTNVSAQRRAGRLLNANEKHDVGIFGGTSTYLGDFNEKNFLYYPNPLGGLLYRYNFNPYFSARAQAGYSRVEGSSGDYYGNLPGFSTKGVLAFDRSVFMLDGLIELNFLPYSPVDKKRMNIFTPYLALGIGANFIGSNSYNNNPQLDMAANIYPEIYGDPGKTFSQATVFEIPMGLGVKVSPVHRLTIAGEWTFKKMFYDNIDGFTNRGGGSFSLINDDWVSTITISLTYRFASSWRCDAYPRGVSSVKMRGLKGKTYNVNVMQSAAKDMRKPANVKKLEGRSENSSNKIKKKKNK